MRLRTVGAAYVACVFGVAALGFFFTDSTFTILLAAALSLPASVVALPGYYAAYGLLALVPGANPSSSSGSRACTAEGICGSTKTVGDPAPWFLVTTDVLGVLAFTGAGLVNLIAVTLLCRQRRRTPRT